MEKSYQGDGILHLRKKREKCPNTEFFLARICLYLDLIEKIAD